MELAKAIDQRCRLTGEFTLRSGRIVSEYFDKYQFEADPELLGRVVTQMQRLVPADTELLGGLELGGIPLVTLLSQRTGIAAVFVRKEPKTYGTRRAAEGADCTGRTVTLVEDVITTGGAVVNAARLLRAEGATVTTVICAIDREESGREALAAAGIVVRAILTRTELDAVRG